MRLSLGLQHVPGVLLLALWLWCGQCWAVPPAPDARPEAALSQMLDEARSQTPGGCTTRADRLERVLCQGVIRVGVRNNYKLFGLAENGKRSGFEVAIARHIAQALGVELVLVTVAPANRLASLAEDQTDLVIATMGHTTARDREVRFIRPHYYSSSTALVGRRDIEAPGFAALAGRTVCATVGNASTSLLSQNGARLLLFDSPEQLIDQLNAQACTLVAQDDSFFAQPFTSPEFAARYAEKFRFSALPWGMAVASKGGERLAAVLGLSSQIMHRDGVFLALATEEHIDTGFLRTQLVVWSADACNRLGFAENCVLAPLRTDLAPTGFAPLVIGIETWFGTQLGMHPTLGIFKLAPAWELLRAGIANTLMLVVGALIATLGFAVLIGRALCLRFGIVRRLTQGLVMLVQSSPIVLSLTIGAAVVNEFVTFSAESALITAMIVLGLTNGANAGQAIADAVVSLRDERSAERLFGAALLRASTQITAFLINAAKGTPVASLIGAPELLNAVSDSGSFTSDRITIYWLLLVFYVAVVLLVSWLCRGLRRMLDRAVAA